MVRFKNRYILADYSHMNFTQDFNQRSILKIIKDIAEEMMGQLFLAKITFSLQIKYMSLGKVLIRVPRDHCADLQACLFVLKGFRIIKISGTIRCIQTKMFEILRKQLRRQLSKGQEDQINKIDYS